MTNTAKPCTVLSMALSVLISVSSCLGAQAQTRFLGVARPAPHSHHVVHTIHPSHKHTLHHVVQYSGSRRSVVEVSHHGRHHRRGRHAVASHPVRHAYPLNFFMMNAPEFDRSPLSAEQSREVRQAFDEGTAEKYPARMLVRAGIAGYHPLHGGIFWRREAVKYIIVHSTETGVPQDAPHVINSWNSGGRRHAGAQYVVDRDGTIYCAVDPDLATVHVNIFKTLPGINNDNTIGIEMVHAGHQVYTPEQKLSVTRLVAYLQGRYQVADGNVITHRYAQQGDHTDPVAFDWDGFLANKDNFRSLAMSKRLDQIASDAEKTWTNDWPVASTFLQLHGKLPVPAVTQTAGKAPVLVPNTASVAPAAAVAPPVAPSLGTPATAPPVAAAQLTRAPSPAPAYSRAIPALRGPIEIDPKAASLLNSAVAPQD